MVWSNYLRKLKRHRSVQQCHCPLTNRGLPKANLNPVPALPVWALTVPSRALSEQAEAAVLTPACSFPVKSCASPNGCWMTSASICSNCRRKVPLNPQEGPESFRDCRSPRKVTPHILSYYCAYHQIIPLSTSLPARLCCTPACSLRGNTCFPSVKAGGYFAVGLCNTEAVLMAESIKGVAGLQEVYGFTAGDTSSEFVPLSLPMPSIPSNTSAANSQPADSWQSLNFIRGP